MGLLKQMAMHVLICNFTWPPGSIQALFGHHLTPQSEPYKNADFQCIPASTSLT